MSKKSMIKPLWVDDRFSIAGIGMAICKKMIERYDASIPIESQPEQGSGFRLAWAGRERKS